ncbi:MAG: hypothetical protein ABSD97_06615 [Acidimicrobiales bacterium]|jgi:hypothetical protein
MSTGTEAAEQLEASRLDGAKAPLWRRSLPVVVVLAIYLCLGVVSNLPSWLGGVAHTMQCGGCGDSGQEVWFLAWGSHALTHLTDPLRTNWLNFPWGVDLADNTSMPLAGAIGTPITVLFGPVATFNVLFSLAFASSAAAMFFLLRRFTTWIPAAFVGGLLYGFCPYMVGQGEGHLFLLLAAMPPLMVLLLDEILIRQSARWWLVGIALGLVMIVQLGWSAEVLACALTIAVIGIVVLAIARRHLVRDHLPYALKASVLAVVMLIPVAAWFGLVSRTGPEHVPGAVHSVKELGGLSSDLAGFVIPSFNQHFSFGLAHIGTSFVYLTNLNGSHNLDLAENGSYIGIPIVLLLILGAVRFHREGIVRFSVLMAAVAALFSMGSRLKVWDHLTVIRLPFDVLAHLPFVQSEVPSRYCLLMSLFVALAVGVVLDRARWVKPRRNKVHGRAGYLRRFAYSPLPLFLVLAVAGVVSLVPAWPYNIGPVVTPPALEPPIAAPNLAGGTLLTYPLARNNHVLAMVWQSIDGFQYRIPAGEATVANDHAGATESAFATCWKDDTEYEPSKALIPAARANFVVWQVRAVVIPLRASVNPMCGVRFVQAVLGRAPDYERDAAVWTDVHLGQG